MEDRNKIYPRFDFRLSKEFVQILESYKKKNPIFSKFKIGRIAKCMLLGYMVDKEMISLQDIQGELLIEGVAQALENAEEI